jgi:hypothetical protein
VGKRKGTLRRDAPEGLLLTVAQFNRFVPVGTPVRYYPVSGDSRYVETRTRSEAWALGCDHVVAKVEGIAGGVHVTHLELREVTRAKVTSNVQQGRAVMSEAEQYAALCRLLSECEAP